MYEDIRNKKDFDYKTVLAGIDPKDYVTILDKEYSDDMRNLKKPPLVIDKRKMRR